MMSHFNKKTFFCCSEMKLPMLLLEVVLDSFNALIEFIYGTLASEKLTMSSIVLALDS